jgi:biotin carboxyl carrier protein
LASALEWHALPLGGLLRTLGWLRLPRTLLRLAVVSAVVVGLLFALRTIEVPLAVDVDGQLVPVARQDVFAPRSGLVDAVRVAHGNQVAAGESLVVLRDPALADQMQQLRGEQTKATRQLEAVRATRTTASGGDALERYRLSAEEEELKTELDNLARQLKLLEQQAAALDVTSPLAGTVTTWRVDERLALGRPVERGQVLLTVADTAGDWLLELSVPDDRMDLLREADDEQLQVEYRLASDASQLHTATVRRMAERVDTTTTPTGSETRTVTIEATPNEPLEDELLAAALRPGGSVRARIVVGDRALGTVLFHDLTRTLRNWWEF